MENLIRVPHSLPAEVVVVVVIVDVDDVDDVNVVEVITVVKVWSCCRDGKGRDINKGMESDPFETRM